MKQIDGIEALKQILIIYKSIFEIENKIANAKIFEEEFLTLNLDIDIVSIVANLINYTDKYKDWIYDVIYDYADNTISLEEAINQLLVEV